MRIRNTFFGRLLAQLLTVEEDQKAMPARAIREAHERNLKNKGLQRLAQGDGVNRRLEMHLRSCEDAYRAKVARVEQGRGKNTLSGIPQEFHPVAVQIESEVGA